MTGSVVQSVDNVALLPAYLAAGTAVLVLLADLLVARARVTVATAALGAVATAAGAALVGAGDERRTFCVGPDCSYVFGGRAALVAVVVALLTLGVLGLSGPLLRAGRSPVGEYCFLLACSMTGGVVLGAAGDLITLIVAVETLTLPLYVLVGLRRGSLASAEAAVTFFVVSVVATTLTLLGAALLYAVTGGLHLDRIGALLAERPELRDLPLTTVAVALVVLGLAFKVAAVPFHAWAPATYDGAPLPVAAYLSTASKLGGVVALLAVVQRALPADVTGPVLAGLAVLTMTVGNLVALRQRRTVRLLAWSSVAQAGYILAPLGALALASGRADDARSAVYAAAVAYAVFFVVLELAAFAGVVALRPADADGGTVGDLRGAARRHPWRAAGLGLALVGLAGLPPGLAGLFAKVTVVRSLLGGGAGWLAVVVAVNAVIGLAYYLRLTATLWAEPVASVEPAAAGAGGDVGSPAVGSVVRARTVGAVLAVTTAVAVVIGLAPQLLLDVAAR
ncbi:NADH-quinone oxidoreductase subunit N [Micromonospora endolithica]|uniref:NADH-quinone oxidoreductase subunit N n=1 Tax=Micromonospora endolithica TaxID=230091 RepID=A0A3A9Z7D3_9ACTN|nr:proton-conducting transporter membrane subunit [Micromonospora endolithica]RKN44291.1 NADH-quinone oxidoreductase subunit N [Micromonospora endolithica]TWJ25766.1 NADH-quinone oxidoreductase subunit N [Micromonospora endolithica]